MTDNILGWLADERILDVDIKPEGIRFREGCDQYFYVHLNSGQVRRLAKQLMEIADEADAAGHG